MIIKPDLMRYHVSCKPQNIAKHNSHKWVIGSEQTPRKTPKYNIKGKKIKYNLPGELQRVQKYTKKLPLLLQYIKDVKLWWQRWTTIDGDNVGEDLCWFIATICLLVRLLTIIIIIAAKLKCETILLPSQIYKFKTFYGNEEVQRGIYYNIQLFMHDFFLLSVMWIGNGRIQDVLFARVKSYFCHYYRKMIILLHALFATMLLL